MKVLITGGHITPALAVADELKNVEVVFVGRKFALSSDSSESLEFKEIKKKGFTFLDLPAGRLTRTLTLQTITNVIRIPLGFLKAFLIVQREKPNVVLTFGGYIALPIAVAAYLNHVPVITHEQTIRPGAANRFIGRLARRIFISFPEAKKYFPLSKVILSGNPIRHEVGLIQREIPNFKKIKPILYITGGSLGSHDINKMVFEILPELLKTFIVIHQTGSSSEFKDDEYAKSLKSQDYFSYDHIESDLVGFVYGQADLVIGRAGANTVFELLALKKPSILIPLPWSAFGEQQLHAEYMKSLGVAEVFDQTKGSDKLLLHITEMYRSLEKYRKNFDTINLPYDSTSSAKQISKEVLANASNATST